MAKVLDPLGPFRDSVEMAAGGGRDIHRGARPRLFVQGAIGQLQRLFMPPGSQMSQAVAREVAASGVVFLVDAVLARTAVQDPKALLALAAADDLADAPGANTSIAATVRPSSLRRM